MRISRTIISLLALALAASCAGQQEETASVSGNPVIENIMSRRSIRKYKADPVPRETLDKILECGINAPNGQNKQSWEIRVVDNAAHVQEIQDAIGGSCFRGAPVMVFIARDLSYDMSPYDCGLLCGNICLSAHSLGVGSIVLGSPVRAMNSQESCKPYLDKLGFSEGYELCICVGLGYADEAPDAKPRDINKIKYVTL